MALIRMFESFGLKMNLGKINSVVCTSRFIWGYQGEVAYKWQEAGEGDMFR